MADVMTPPTARLEQKVAARTEDAVKIYGKGQTEVRALDGVSVEFAAGRYTAVMGPSGSGKSTLLHCVAGLDSLTSGPAFIGEVNLSTLNDQRLTILRRDRVGFVFQGRARRHGLLQPGTGRGRRTRGCCSSAGALEARRGDIRVRRHLRLTNPLPPSTLPGLLRAARTGSSVVAGIDLPLS